MSRAELIKAEMASGVRLLGSSGRTASEQNHFASRMTGLPVTVVERLRWRKLRRVPADVADAVREALEAFTRHAEAKARHERDILTQRLEAFARMADQSGDPEFYRSQVAGVVEQARRYGLLDSAVDEAKD